jgi:hypothetical protein
MSLRRALAITGCVLVQSWAEAGPPFVTDDPETPSTGGWEINLPFVITRTDAATEMDVPLVDLNYGLPKLQLSMDIPIRVSREDEDGGKAGLGDLLLGVKWRFLENARSQFQLAINPQWLVPTGDHSRGLGEGNTAFLFPVLAQKDFGRWKVYGNVGFWWQTAAASRNYFYSGIALEREVSKRLTLGAELFGSSPKEQASRSEIAFNLGGAWKISDHFNLLFSGGRDLAGEVSAMGYIGVQILTR